jgi:flagellar biosynthesis/type III secretory pathway protein FliH
MDTILVNLKALVDAVEAMKVQLADAQAALDQVKAQGFDEGKVVGLEEGKKLGFDEGYAKGFEDGKASVPPVTGDKIYSQEELDAAVKSAVEPLQAQVTELQAKVDGIPALLEEAVANAKAEVKAEFKAAWEASQAVEGEAEGAFAKLFE